MIPVSTSNTNEPEAVPPSLNVTSERLHRIGMACARDAHAATRTSARASRVGDAERMFMRHLQESCCFSLLSLWFEIPRVDIAGIGIRKRSADRAVELHGRL